MCVSVSLDGCDVALCEHPKCNDPYPHAHAFLSVQCREGKHMVCRAVHQSEVTDAFTETELMQRHAEQNHELMMRGITMKDATYWRIAEQQRLEWERYIEVRDGKRKPRMAMKVWTCRCKCHGGNPNGGLPLLSESMSLSGEVRLAQRLAIHAK